MDTANNDPHISNTADDDENENENENETSPGIMKSNRSEISLNISAEFSESYNEEELKNLAESLAPRVNALLNSNEAALENLLSINHQAWLDEEEKFGIIQSNSDEEDGIQSECDHLADAEQLLSDELEVSDAGFHFMTYMNGSDSDADADGDSGGDADGEEKNLTDEAIKNERQRCTHEVEGIHSSIDHTLRRNLSVDEIPMTISIDVPESSPAAVDAEEEQYAEPSTSASSSLSKKEVYTIYDHAKHVGLLFDNADLGYPTCPLLTKEDAESILDVPGYRHDMHSLEDPDIDLDSEIGSGGDYDNEGFHESEINNGQNNNRKDAIRDIMECTREYVKPMTSAALSRIYTGLAEGSKNIDRRRKKKDGDDSDEDDVGVSIKASNGGAIGDPNREIVPVRTVAIQIRPDVLVGAVMDAVYTSINSLQGQVTKRQGGHLRALLPGQWVKEHDYVPFRDTVAQTGSISKLFGSPMQPTQVVVNGMIFLPPLVIDVQLCTKKKSRLAERILIVRSFSIAEGQILDNGDAVCPPKPPQPYVTIEQMQRASSSELNELRQPNNFLRESSSLFQRMRSVATLGGNIAFDLGELLEENDANDSFESQSTGRQQESGYVRNFLTSPLKLFSPSQKKKTPRRSKQKALNVRFGIGEKALFDPEAAQMLVSGKLLSVFTETPSVLDEVYDVDPIASLSRVDWPYVQSSWSFLRDCLNELDNRDLAYR